jgi:ABC-type multidrug transport system permease subunit
MSAKTTGWLNRVQTDVLARRYFAIWCGDPKSLGFLCFQPVAVAWCAGIIWQGTTPDERLYFILSFSAIFFGCVNACREIVKERAIFLRERLVNIEIPAYVASKAWVLAQLGFLQTLLFYVGCRYFLVLEGFPPLFVLVLYTGVLAGTALGLFLSAMVRSDVVALGLVPVVLVPQLLFSRLILPIRALEGPVAWLEQTTLAKWSFKALELVVAADPAWFELIKSLGALLGLSAVLLLATGLTIKWREVWDA